jgi:hypothetical protein
MENFKGEGRLEPQSGNLRFKLLKSVCFRIGPKGAEVTGEWRKWHNEELHILYSSQILLGRSNQGE